jgi:hypothetical protein
MDKACEIINKIQDFDQNVHLLTEVYEQSSHIMWMKFNLLLLIQKFALISAKT